MSSADYKIEAEVSTSNAVANLRNMRSAASELDGTLRQLNATTAAGERDLNSYAQSVSKIIAAQSQAAKATTELANARLKDAQAAAAEQKATDQHSESLGRQALNEARAGQASQQANLASARAATESVRTQSALAEATRQTATATQQHSTAQDQAANSTRRAAQSQLELTDNLSNTRYLLYDVGATYRTMALGLEAIPTATAVVAASYQKDFAQVIRVTESTATENENLRSSLKDIADQVPVSFGQLTQIAQLGAQMGIPTQALSDFTDVTAKFVAVTGVAADTASSLFGRLDTAFNAAGDIPDFFNKVGSSIARVGADTVATDPEIASMLNQIGSLGASAGMTADQTIGLAAALASVRVQPELARGTLTRVFANLDRDMASGGKSLAAYAKLLGVTQEQAANLWKTDPSAFFQQMIKGFNDIYKSGGNLTTTFDALGIKSVRDVSAMTKLAVGYDTLAKSMTSASNAFADGNALNDMSKPVFETVAAKIQVLTNAFQNLADSLGRGGLAPLAGLIDTLSGAVKWITDLADQAPAVKILINVLLGLAAVTGVFLGIKAAQAYVLAGMISMRSAMSSSAAETLNVSGLMKQLSVNMLMAKGATEQQATAMVKDASAIKALGVAVSSTNGSLRSAQAATAGATTSMTGATGAASRFGSGIKAAGASLLSLAGGLPGLITMLGVGLVGALMSAEQAAKDAGQAIGEAMAKGGDQAGQAIVDQLKSVKLGAGDTPLFGEWGKSLADLADRSGLDMTKVVSAMQKGKQGIADLRAEVLQFARDNGKQIVGDKLIGSVGTWEGDTAVLLDKLAAMADAADTTSKSSDKLAAAEKALGISSADASGNLDDTTSAADNLDKALKALNDTIFGTVDAEAAVGDSMNKLGAGLQKSGSFGNNVDGRANVKNFEDSLAAAQKYYAQLQQAGKATSDEAAKGYSDFVDALIKKTQAMGGQLGPIEGLAHQTVDGFRSAIGADVAANPPSVPVKATVNVAQAQQAAVTAANAISTFIGDQRGMNFAIGASTDEASTKIQALAHDLATITGMPYQAVLDALTDPANKNAKAMQDYITQIVNGTYKAAVNADTTAATTNVKNFYNYAVSQLSALQSAINSIAASGAPGLAKYIGQSKGIVPGQGIPYKAGGYSFPDVAAAPAQVSAAPVAAAAGSSAAAAMPALANMAQGYNDAAAKADKAAASAEKAGKKGKQAGQDTANAWKDAGNGIDQATAAADDYASRLKQGLDRAFERQYGLQEATDAYHKQLNAIAKTREDDLKKVDDLVTKTRQLNDERNKDLIDAGKAKIEQGISLKYGETARAADYGNQAQTALDNAASKQKEIDANNKDAATIKAGIGLLTGYSDAAIANREAVRTLEQKMNDMTVAYAKNGATIDQVRAFASNLNGQFQRDVGQIGFNQAAVQNLTGDLGRYIDVINRIPYVKPTTVTANVGTSPGADGAGGSGALGDLGQFQSALDNATQDKTVTVGVHWDFNMNQLNDGLWAAQRSFTNSDGSTVKIGNGTKGFASGGLIPGTPPSDPRKDNMLAHVDGKGVVQVRSREFIEPQEAVDYYGVDFMEKIRTLSLPRFNFGGSVGGGHRGGGASGPMLVEFTAEQFRELVSGIGADVKVMVDSREIARASNKGNRELQKEGAR